MPCYDDRNDPENVAEDVREDCIHNSIPAELLCAVLKAPRNSDIFEIPGLAKWWAAHQRRDKQKAEEERIRKDNAISGAKKQVRMAQSRLNRLLKKG